MEMKNNVVDIPNNRMTFVRNENGTWGEKAGKAVVTVAEFTKDFFFLLSDLFHGMMTFAIKIGLLVFLYPYIVKFVIEFAKLLSQASGVPFPRG